MTEEKKCDSLQKTPHSSTLLAVADRYMHKGRFREAEQALENFLATYAAEDKEQISPLVQLAEIKRELGNFWESEQLAKQALSLKQRYQDFSEFETVLLLLANVLHDQGRFEEAEILYKESKELFESLYGAEHQKVAQCLIDLGELERERGRFEPAEFLFIKAKKMLEKHHGGMQSKSYIEVLNNLGLLYHELDKYEDAANNFREALNAMRNSVNDDRLEATVNNNFGRLLYKKESPDYVGAESLIRGALLIREQFGPSHPDIAISLRDLSDLYLSLGRFDEAKAYLKRALEIREKIYGSESARLITILQSLAAVCIAMDDFAFAKEYLVRALALRALQFGEQDPGLLPILERLVHISEKLGELEQSSLYSEKMKDLEKTNSGDADSSES
jgi:tetratricopeptide (TPR) repeat protein